jgi:hypothetical protein
MRLKEPPADAPPITLPQIPIAENPSKRKIGWAMLVEQHGKASGIG